MILSPMKYYVEKICCNYWSSNSSKLTPDHTHIVICKKNMPSLETMSCL